MTTCFGITFCIDSGCPFEVADMRSAHAGACLLSVGHFQKVTILRFIWGSFWNQKGNHNPNYTNLGNHFGDFWGICLRVFFLPSKTVILVSPDESNR